MNKLTLKTEGDRQIIVTRAFAAPPELVYRAHTEAELIRRWLLGPEGWSMPSCVCDARPGGGFRYDWAHPERGTFYITGEFIELVPFSRIVHVERMFLPDRTPDNRVETRFTAQRGGALMTMLMTLPDERTRDGMLATGMEHGMEASYARFESEFAGPAADGSYAVVNLEPQLTAAVMFEAAFSELPSAERKGREKIAAALPNLDVEAGLSCTLCRVIEGGKMHYEPGVIVNRTFVEAGDVVSSRLPGGRAVKYTLVGPFEQLPQAWPALFAWCESHGLKRSGAFWQIYGPTPADLADQETALYALLD